MSHAPNVNTNTSGFNYPSAAGIPTNTDQTHLGDGPSASSSSTVPLTTNTDHLGPAIDRHQGKLEGEHGGAGTRNDDRKGMVLHNDGHTATPAVHEKSP